MDVARLASNLWSLRKLDGRAIVFENGGGAILGKAIRIEQVAEVGHTAATAGQANIFGLHA